MSETGDPHREAGPEARQNSGRAKALGVALLAVAVLSWALAAGVVFLPISGGHKLWATSALLVVGEISFWLSAAVLGRELFRRYRSYLDPRRLFGLRKP